uniref:NACHT domain-containing protein n=1 Tax=Canis lupus familiaris TaxID=9615 RepID=A0A8C0LQ78_CANLF
MCSFIELLAQSAPDLQDALAQVLTQAQKLLFVIDAFEELRVPSGVEALVHDLCVDWKTQRPASTLLGSLLKRKLLPTAALLVTTRPEALRELRLMVEQPLFVEIEGLSECDRKAYFLRHFGEEAQALRAFHLMKSNATLFQMGAAPAVCWMVCTCLKLQMDEGEDPGPTCQTTTSLLLRFLCSQFAPAQGSCLRLHLRSTLHALCLLATEGVWTQTSVFDGHDLLRLGVHESDLHPFLNRNILQKSRDCEGCYCFLHLSVQQFLAAALYILGSQDHQDLPAGSPSWDVGNVQRLLSKEEGLKNPYLAPVGHFLFGLTNEKRARELGMTFGCLVSTKVKQELLECRVGSPENRPFSSVTDTKETLHCLYESQEEQLVKEAMVQVTEVSLVFKDTSDIMHASFCLKHCESFLKNIFPADAYRNFCIAFGGHETLTHLTLQGNDQNDMLPILCEILRHPKCNLQYLRLVSCSATTQQWAHLSSSLKINQSLTCLNLTANELPDESAKLLCTTLRHPKCFLQRLSLENCQLTEACCKELSSALIVNQRLTHLSLAKNTLGDDGVKLLCEGLSYPDCQLQMLVLWYCSITSGGCNHLSTLLQQNSNLTHLDLGLNHIGITGLKFLCEALKNPMCNLKCLWLWGCAITPFSSEILSSALGRNQSLVTLDLGQNSLGYSGIKMLCDTLKLHCSSLRTLRLKIDESDPRIQKLLKEIQEYDPQLTIESDDQDPTNNRPSSHDFIF